MENKRELAYKEFLVENKFDPTTIDWTYITDASKKQIEDKVIEIESYIKDNQSFESYSEEEKDKKYEVLDSMNTELKDLIRNAKYKITLNGNELNQIKDWVRRDCEYDSQSVFYGIHLDATFLSRYNMSVQPLEEYVIDFIGGETILLYELLGKMKLTGLKEKSYMFASTLRKLSETTKIYNHYDNVSAMTFKQIAEWNFGLSKKEAEQFKKEVAKVMATELIEEAKG